MVHADESEKFRKKVYNALVPGALLHGSLSMLEAEQQFFNDNEPLMLDEALEKAGYRSLTEFVDAHPNDIKLTKTQFGLTLLPGLSPPELIRDNMRLIRTTQRHNRPNPYNIEKGIASQLVQRRMRNAGHRFSVGLVEKKCLGLSTGASLTGSRSSAVPAPIPGGYRPAAARFGYASTSRYPSLSPSSGISRYSSASRPSRSQYRPPGTFQPRLQTGYFQRFVVSHVTAPPSISNVRATTSTTSWSQMQSSYGTVERTVSVQTSNGFSCTIPPRPPAVTEQIQHPQPSSFFSDRGNDISPWDMPAAPTRSASAHVERACEPQTGMSNAQFLAASTNRFRSRSARGGRFPRLPSDVVQDDWGGDGYENEFHNHTSDESDDDFAIPVRKVVPYDLASTDPAISEVGPKSPENVPPTPADQHAGQLETNLPVKKVQAPQLKQPETPKVTELVKSAVPVKGPSPPPSVPVEPKENGVETENALLGRIRLRRRVPGASGRDSVMSETSTKSKMSVVRFADEVKVCELARKESFRRPTLTEPASESIDEQPEAVNTDSEKVPDSVFGPPETDGAISVTDGDSEFYEHRSVWADRLKRYYEFKQPLHTDYL